MKIFRFISCNTCSLNITRNISLDAALPIFMVPILMLIAVQNAYCTVVTFVSMPIMIYYINLNYLRFIARTKFFIMWTLSSIVTLMLVFELNVVPQMEILPEENLVFIMCVCGGLYSGYVIRKKSEQASSRIAALELGEAGEIARKLSSNAVHCNVCQVWVRGRKCHCHWLDTCIGSNNFRWYFTCLFFSAAAFIYGSNLAMTTVCHPFIFIGTILLPDDCSDVYYQIDLAICFVASVYSLLIGLALIIILVYNIWSLFFGKNKKLRILDIFKCNRQCNDGAANDTEQLSSRS